MDFTPVYAKGFTLIELLITLTIVGILTSLAAPTFSSLKAKNTMASSVNLFLAQLHMARSSAVTRERHITLCPTVNTTDCSDDYRA